MKRHINLCIALAAILFTMVSCLENNDNNETTPTLTQAQVETQLAAANGDYSGMIYGYNPYLGTTDSLSGTWNVTDSTLTVNIPKKIITSIATSTTNKLLTDDEGTAESKHKLIPYYNESTNIYTYSMYPKNEKLTFNALINEKDANIVMTYSSYYIFAYYTYYYPICQYGLTNRDFIGYIPVYGVSVDSGANSASAIIILHGKKN